MKALKNTPLRAALYVALLIAGLFGSAGIAVAQEPTPDQQSAIRSNCAPISWRIVRACRGAGKKRCNV